MIAEHIFHADTLLITPLFLVVFFQSYSDLLKNISKIPTTIVMPGYISIR